MRNIRIDELYDVQPQRGEVGIEIEMEGRGLVDTHHKGMEADARFPWEFKADGSLRGESCEWVLKKPLLRPAAEKALDALWDAKGKASAKFEPSKRCGVHIHMNVQSLTETQVWNLIATFIAFEPLLVRWVGEDREGNLFCLRASDARELIERLAFAREAGSFNQILSDQIRYASVNVNSLARYGSLEFRVLGTPAQPGRIVQWIKMLYAVRELSLKYDNIRDLLYAMSAANPQGFIRDVFGPKTVLALIQGREQLLREGMRNLQDMLVTKSPIMPRFPNLPGEGWHVVDPDEPGAERAWQQRQQRRAAGMPEWNPLHDLERAVPVLDEPNWDGLDEPFIDEPEDDDDEG